MGTRFVFFSWKRPEDDRELRDLEHMLLYGVEELLDLGERGLYFDPALHARGMKAPAGRAPEPDIESVRFHVHGTLVPDAEKKTVRVRLGVKDIQTRGRALQKRLSIPRPSVRRGRVPFDMTAIHGAHRKLYLWLAELAGLDPPVEQSYHAYRLTAPVTEVPEAFRELVRGLREARELEAKLEHYRRAVGLDPLLGRAHRNLGYLLRARGDLQEAIAHYETAAATLIDEAGLGEVHFEMGLSHAGLKEYRESIRCWKRSLRFSPHRREALYNIGLAYEELGSAEEAIHYYSKARRVDTGYLSALEGLFRLHIQEGSYLKAVGVLKDWIKITPHDAGLHRIIGHCYRKEGMSEEARRHLKRAVELDPEGEIGREARRDMLDL